VSGSLAVLIPPSIILVLYGAVTGESVGSLLIAGIVPGIISAVILASFALYRAWRKPFLVEKIQNQSSQLNTLDTVFAQAESPANNSDKTLELDTWSVVRAVTALILIFTIRSEERRVGKECTFS